MYQYFPFEEYKNRWDRARKLMDERDIDALLITSKPNYTYMSGHRTGMWAVGQTRVYAMLLPKEGEATLIPHIVELYDIPRTSWIKNIKTWEKFPFKAEYIKEAIDDLGLSSGSIGCELGYEQRLAMPYSDFMSLQRQLPEAKFVDASDIFWKLRVIKSNGEIEYLRKAAEITSAALDKTFNTIRAGMSERDVASIFFKSMMDEGADSPGFIFMASGIGLEKLTASHFGPTDLTLKSGDCVEIDGGCIYRGYCAEHCRVGIVGMPSEKQIRMHNSIKEITSKCIDLVRPGTKSTDISELSNQLCKKAGLPERVAGRIGHSIGLDFTEPPSIGPFDETILQPGMVISVEPGAIADYGYFCLEENVLVTQTGYEILSNASTELHRIK
jgi:Xaa-Pro dipeptidase